jgi:hypothetical protein
VSAVDEHVVSSLPDVRRVGVDRTITRYRGRCSCGEVTFMHYATPDSAKTAIRRTHIARLALNER